MVENYCWDLFISLSKYIAILVVILILLLVQQRCLALNSGLILFFLISQEIFLNSGEDGMYLYLLGLEIIYIFL